ncbi:MAG: DNA adenine methylase [Bacteroides sp.]|nr:DNA adenine methylase [Bacteroides sp.]
MDSTNYKHKAKPFLKWAGGKTQLLPIIEKMLPSSFNTQTSITYIEPFVGGGAVLFHLLQKYPNITNAVINDINPHLINTYHTIKYHSDELIARLSSLQSAYNTLSSVDAQKAFFLDIRDRFNSDHNDLIDDAAYMIFLNRTCFNGLYRENSLGKFNVSFGRYKNPSILDENTIRAVSEILQKVNIIQGDFSQIESFISDQTFIYFDPPYRPISSTSVFTAYNKGTFNDREQYRLKEFFAKLSNFGCSILLSNSDGKSIDPNNTFLDKLYTEYIIHRVFAKRSISCSGTKRGPISELLIRNYKECLDKSISYSETND